MSQQQLILQEEKKLKLKLSEIFYEADKKGVKQIKHKIADGLGGYCAAGIIAKHCGLYYDDDVKNFVIPIYDPICSVYDEINNHIHKSLLKHGYHSVATMNDIHGWTFKDFGDFFASVGE